MEKKPKICILRWEEGQVLPAQLQLESLPGNSTNPASYPFEVMMLRVKGANMDTIEENPCQEMLDKFIVVCKELAAQGVKAITTSCGFTAYYQEAWPPPCPSWCSPAPCYRSPSSRPWWAPTQGGRADRQQVPPARGASAARQDRGPRSPGDPEPARSA